MLKKIIVSFVMLLTISILYADFQSCLQEAIEESKKEGWSESEELVAIAACHYNYGKFEEALETLIKADSMGLPEEYNKYINSISSQLYAELGNFNEALIRNERVRLQMISEFGSTSYKVEFQNLYYKFMLGIDITESKKNILSGWKVDSTENQYLVCEFLLKTENYQAALEAITDYDNLLKKHELTETNLQYILFVQAYYELGNYKKAKEYYSLALAKNKSAYDTECYLHYWNSLINYKLGKTNKAISSFNKCKNLGWNYHERIMLLSLWHFSEKNLKVLEKIENLVDNSYNYYQYFDLNNSNIEINYQSQINKEKHYFGNFNIFNVQFALKNTPITIGGSQLKISSYTMNKKTYLSLNSCSIIVILMALTFDRDKMDNKILKTIASATTYGIAIPNTILNMQIQLKLDKKDNIRFFAGTTGDLFIINNQYDIKYTIISGISLFNPFDLKLFYAKDVYNLKGVSENEYFGISLGIHRSYW